MLKGAIKNLISVDTKDMGLWGEINLTSQMYEQSNPKQ